MRPWFDAQGRTLFKPVRATRVETEDEFLARHRHLIEPVTLAERFGFRTPSWALKRIREKQELFLRLMFQLRLDLEEIPPGADPQEQPTAPA
jgi:hypothetical protein